MKKKTLALVLALTLLVAGVVGGTLAWLTATTGEVQNTFTVGDIQLTLTETPNTDTNKDEKPDVWQAQIIPGYSYDKDPVVTIDNKVDCYLFVKFEETNSKTYLDYTSTLTTDNGWTQGDGTNIPSNVWYRTVNVADTTKSWNLLAGNTVAVKSGLTNEQMTTAASTTITMTYTAYACQLYKNNTETFTAAEAWTTVNS